MRLLAPIALGAALLFAVPALGQTVEKIGPYLGRTLSVPIPEGYCVLERGSDIGRTWYTALQQMNARINAVGVVFIDCEQLRRKEQDANSIPTRHGVAMIPLMERRISTLDLTRSEYIRDFVASGPPSAEDLSEAVSDGLARLEDPDAASRGAGVMLGILDVDENAAYMAQVLLTRFPTGTARLYLVSLTTLLDSLPIFVHLYAPEEGEASLKALLAQSKRLAAELVRVNTPR